MHIHSLLTARVYFKKEIAGRHVGMSEHDLGSQLARRKGAGFRPALGAPAAVCLNHSFQAKGIATPQKQLRQFSLDDLYFRLLWGTIRSQMGTNIKLHSQERCAIIQKVLLQKNAASTLPR